MYPININSVSSERGESVLHHKDSFVTFNKIIPKSFDSTECKDILDAKIGLRKMKSNAQRK